MKNSTKVIIAILVVVVLGAAAAVALNQGNAQGAEVRIEATAARDLTATVTASGNIRARRQVDISSDISARVTSLDVAEGDDVTAGQVLLRLDRTRYLAAVQRAEASLSQASAQRTQQEANLLTRQREYDRTMALKNRDPLLVSDQQVETAETNLQVAEANVESARYAVAQAEAGVAEAQDQLSKTVIIAPIDGKITRLNVEEGETVIVGTMNNAGSLILSISDLSVVEAVVQVDETDVPLLALGDSAIVNIDAFPDREFAGIVTEIGNSAIRPPSQQAAGQQAAIDFEVVITLENPGVDLRPDLSSTADIITDTRRGALSVPIIALTVRDPESEPEAAEAAGIVQVDDEIIDIEGVFVVSGGIVTFRPVEVGIAGEEHFEILSGISMGDSIVAGPYHTIRTLKSGDPVRPIEDDADGASDEG